jgi:hypothetical protein
MVGSGINVLQQQSRLANDWVLAQCKTLRQSRNGIDYFMRNDRSPSLSNINTTYLAIKEHANSNLVNLSVEMVSKYHTVILTKMVEQQENSNPL